jgi:hypothetical protein
MGLQPAGARRCRPSGAQVSIRFVTAFALAPMFLMGANVPSGIFKEESHGNSVFWQA